MTAPRQPGFVRQVLTIAAKDLRVEWRSREILYTMVLFAVMLVVIFSFAISGGAEVQEHEVAGGILWVAVAFTGTLGLGRIFERERDGETIDALMLSPIPRGALYFGKLLGTLSYLLITEAVFIPLLVGLFHLRVEAPGLLIAVALLGTLGYAVVGSLFAAALMRVRGRAVMLAILTYPIVTPVIVAGTKATAALLSQPINIDGAMIWLHLLIAFDVVFLLLAPLIFGALLSSD